MKQATAVLGAETAFVSLPRSRSAIQWVWTQSRRKPLAGLSGLILLCLVLLAAFAPFIAPYNPEANNVGPLLYAPSLKHLAGTDDLGRDVFSRLLYGARTTLGVSLAVTVMSIAIGSGIGWLSGYLGGGFDLGVQRLIDIMLGFPPLILALAIVAVRGPGVANVIWTLVIVMSARPARVVRGDTLTLLRQQFVEAAQVLGASHVRILVRHIIPNTMASIIVLASITFGLVIIIEATLGFLGLGVPPPTPDWGQMLSAEGRDYMETAPWLAVAPGLAISVAVIAFNLLGDGLRDILDPRLRGMDRVR